MPIDVDRRGIEVDRRRAVSEDRDDLVRRVQPERVALVGARAVAGLREDVLPRSRLAPLHPRLERYAGGRVERRRGRDGDEVVDAVEGRRGIAVAEGAALTEQDATAVGPVVEPH